MSTTARNIIDQAYARSTYNDVKVLAQDTELISRLNLRLGEIWSAVNEIADRSDIYFHKETTVDPAASAWPYPTDVDRLIMLKGGGSFGTGADRKVTAGDEIHLVPFTDQREVPPAVYPRGSSLVSVGRADDPSATTNGDKITFVYARFPVALDPTKAATHADNTLDASWPERFNSLLVCDMALYLAQKDSRFTIDGPGLKEEEAAALALLFDHVSGRNRAMRSRWGQRKRLDQRQG